MKSASHTAKTTTRNAFVSLGHLSGGALVLVAISMLSFSGCRICSDCEDVAYPAYGGAWQRTIRDRGRVGSIFEPAGARASELFDRDTPDEVDERERKRQSATEDDDEGTADDDFESMDSALEDAEESAEDARERRERELRNLDLRDIDVVPGEPLPPVMQ